MIDNIVAKIVNLSKKTSNMACKNMDTSLVDSTYDTWSNKAKRWWHNTMPKFGCCLVSMVPIDFEGIFKCDL